jgi:tRNA(adenine34) deaminase
MWDGLSRPWQACLEQAWLAYQAGSLPIGAVVVDRDGKILSRGRNRIFEGTPEGLTLFGHRLAHAELNALVQLEHDVVDPSLAVLYTTTEPCALCVGAVRMYRLGELHYGSRDPAAGSISLLTASPYMLRGGVRVVGPERSDLETMIGALHIEVSLRTGNFAGVVEPWSVQLPESVRVGRWLCETGSVAALAQDAVPTGEMVNFVAHLLAAR